MNFISEAEKVLRHYRDMQASLPNLEKRIARLVAKAGPRYLKAIDLEEMGKGTAEEETFNLICEIKELTECRDLTRAAIDEIDEILSNISKDSKCTYYGPVLRSWYVDGIHKEDIAKEIGYSSRQSIYDVRKLAIRKFAVQLYGVKALKSI